MKTPEEIKNGLECCAKGNSCRGHCPYDGRSAGIKECTSQLARDALTLIPRWISVEERLPEGNDDVLVFVQHPISGHCWMKIAHHVNTIGMDECEDDEWWLDGSGETVSHITHWMPLPEEPKEE